MRARFLALLALAPLPAGAAPEPLLANGGFEKGLDGWQAQDASGVFKVEVDPKVRRAGRASAHLLKKGGPAQFRADALSAAIPKVPAGAKVAVSAQVRGKDLQNAWLKFMAYDAQGEQLLDEVAVNEENLLGTFDWREVKREFAIPPAAVRAEIALYLYRDGEAWLDEVAVLGLGKGAPPKKEAAKALDAATRKWLDGNAVKVKSLNLRGPLDDLAPLKDILKDARIVQLGEANHGDGTSFAAKARLARFLHEEMGFEVLAFESGLFECDRANELLRKGEPEEAARASVFGIWRNAQAQQAFDYMAEKARSERPLLLAGFDCRASGALAGELWTRLAAFLAPAAPVSAEDLAALRRLDALMDEQGDAYRPPGKDLALGLDALARVGATLESVRARLDAAEAAFFARCLENWKSREAFERAKSDKSLGEHGTTNLRDAAMAANLRWLAEVRHPGKKIVCWAATFHLARGLAGVEMEGNSKFYEGCRNMGQATHETFGKGCYTLGMVAWGGKCGSFGKSFPLDRPKDGSVEDLLHRYGEPFLFVDLRREGPFAGKMRLSPMSHSRNIEARWPEVLDGVLFIDEMAPAK